MKGAVIAPREFLNGLLALRIVGHSATIRLWTRERYRRCSKPSPVNRHLGLRFVSVDEGTAVLALTPREEHRQEGGQVQGGVIASLGDAAAAYALIPGLAPSETMTGVEFKLSFLSPVEIGGEEVRASSRAVRRGRRLGLVEVDIAQGDKLVAKGLFTFLFLPREEV